MKFTKLFKNIFSISLLLLACMTITKSQTKVGSDCEKYRKSREFSEVEKYFDIVNSESEKMELIECLLNYKGNKTPFWGVATSNEVSQTFGPSPLEVIALFKISYLFYGNKEFALAMVLVDDKQKQNSTRSVKTAYKFYELADVAQRENISVKF